MERRVSRSHHHADRHQSVQARGPGGRGAPDWVHVSPIPDVYRGRTRRAIRTPDHSYARRGRRRDRSDPRPRPIAALRVHRRDVPERRRTDLHAAGFLADVYRLVREAGGLCIADEVQTGFGRIGTHFWAFEAHGVMPDIVVLGKPIANGYPMGAVVTTHRRSPTASTTAWSSSARSAAARPPAPPALATLA